MSRLRRIRKRMAASWNMRGRRRLLLAKRAAEGILAAFLLILAWKMAAGMTELVRIEERGVNAQSQGQSIEEGIQIRLDEMRILFFRIQREERRAENAGEETISVD